MSDYDSTFPLTTSDLPHVFPYFNTGDIKPATYGSESAIQQNINAIERDPYIHVSVLEIVLKQYNGILTQTLDYAKSFFSTTAIGNFSPYGERTTPADPNVPEFFTNKGYCAPCDTLATYYYNGVPNNQPSDTDDQRGNKGFLVYQQGISVVTADDTADWISYLTSQNLHNTTYFRSSSAAANGDQLSLDGSEYTPQPGGSYTLLATVSSPAATGTVTFSENGTALGTATLLNGNTSFAVASITGGTHTYTATYSGDGRYPPATSNTFSVAPESSGSGPGSEPGGPGGTAGGSGDTNPPVGSDPLLPFTPGETSTRRPDPSAIYTNGTYYSVESNEDTHPGQDTIYLREASSLAGLAAATPSPIYTDSAGLGELWAPEIMYINGNFYVYFTMGAGSAHRMYVISSPRADGGYTAAQQLNLPGNTWAIDGTTFSYNGQRWFAWSGWPGSTDGEQDIYLAKMNDPVTPVGDRYQISQPREPWEQASGTALLINEGVEAIEDPNGQLHIVYSANNSFTDQYCLGDLRLQVNGNATNVWDWHKSNGCLFGSNGGNMEPDGWYPTLYANGPGHHTFVLPDGDINKSPNAAYPNTAEFMYHAVPKGMNYSWANRVRYVGAYTWYNDINYNRCCVPGTDTYTGYSLMFFEDPTFAPHTPPSGPPPGGGGKGGGSGTSVPGYTGIHNADPSVIRVGDSTYISVETSPDQTSILVREASSPANLGSSTPINRFGTTPASNAIWAPEISTIDGGYIVYFSADSGVGHRMFYAKFASDFTMIESHPLLLPDNQWAVDGNAFVFGGQRWFVWSGTETGDPNEQNLYLVKMSDPTTPTGPRYRISQPHEAWERVTGGPPNNYINEAPAAIIDPDGRLHIVYSTNGSWTEQYCLGDLRLVGGGDPTNVWDWHKSNGCEFGSNSTNMAPGYDPTLYVNGPGSHSFVLLNGDIGFSPTPGAPVPLMYHAVPKGTPYSWDNRQWFNGAFQWYHGPDYTRCCVPGSTDDAGWSIKFYEDPNFGH